MIFDSQGFRGIRLPTFSLRSLFGAVAIAALIFGAFYWLWPGSFSEAQLRHRAAAPRDVLADEVDQPSGARAQKDGR